MVHTVTARAEHRAELSPQPHTHAEQATQRIPSRYVLIPQALIMTNAHDPLAVGVYAMIARLAMVVKRAVALTARDLVAWIGSDREADRAAIMRRIVKLEQQGWLVIARSTNAKHQLLPTWGRDKHGSPHPWRFDMTDCGRPAHLRGRRLPLALLDDYVGRLESQTERGSALISRYLTRPLLDLVDIGTYTIGLHAEIAPTPRLRHLGLWSTAGALAPTTTEMLLTQAAVGGLTTLADDTPVLVGLSIQGYARLGLVVPQAQQQEQTTSREPGGSLDGSSGGSAESAAGQGHKYDQEAPDAPQPSQAGRIAWDVGMSHEQTKHESPCHRGSAGGGAMLPIGVIPAVADGHRRLNNQRPIEPGEWCELARLQQTHGAEQLLIWQSRASRGQFERTQGITPAYYRACAAREACSTLQPQSPPSREPIGQVHPHYGHQATAPLDPARDALLRAMGIREHRRLAAVPEELLLAWQQALAHPGMAAQLASPVGFAVAQMRHGQAPPSTAELERWAERGRRRADRYESWRAIEHVASTRVEVEQEQALEARVRALAPADADLDELCALASWLEAGATDEAVLACLERTRAGERL